MASAAEVGAASECGFASDIAGVSPLLALQPRSAKLSRAAAEPLVLVEDGRAGGATNQVGRSSSGTLNPEKLSVNLPTSPTRAKRANGFATADEGGLVVVHSTRRLRRSWQLRAGLARDLSNGGGRGVPLARPVPHAAWLCTNERQTPPMKERPRTSRPIASRYLSFFCCRRKRKLSK